ncbi:response regulator [Paenibacillus sp. 1001270B_150601_E10]|uniref:response regulator n=1 Tax=Paenibacillus sp. 1001270B_150601_E10 TaxID=2787079 RepID=UPI0018A0F8F5|nr:response regulator [Paenibacillus sp. 1001270B_150601_E10]
MNLLIVEDETRLRHALAYQIPWEDHGIEVVGTASNGIEGLELAARKLPDLMIVDVQMPEMSGLEFIAKLREEHSLPFQKILILSGHDQFTYAQQAMEQGVSKYLLKPAGYQQILSTMLELAEQAKRDMQEWQLQAQLNKKWQAHLPVLRQDMLRQWLGGEYRLMELIHKSNELQLGLNELDRAAVAVLDMDPIPLDETRYQKTDRSLLSFSLHCITQELLHQPMQFVCRTQEGFTVLIVIQKDELGPELLLRDLHASVEQLQRQVKGILKHTVSAGVCAQVLGIEHLHELYRQAIKALQSRIVLGRELVIPYQDTSQEEVALKGTVQAEKGLEVAIETADQARALKCLEEVWTSLMEGAESIEEAYESILYIHSLLIRMIQNQGLSAREVFGDDIRYVYSIELLRTKEEHWSLIHRATERMIELLLEARSSSTHHTITALLSLIEQEMDQELTLHSAADRMFVNSSYLSRLFKQEMGVAFSSYVTTKKMERAKEVLQQGGRVYDAATATGYRDVSYFTKVFRKYWGATPGEFKK